MFTPFEALTASRPTSWGERPSRLPIRVRRSPSVAAYTPTPSFRFPTISELPESVDLETLKPKFEPYDGEPGEEDLLRLDGVGKCFHPERQLMVPMVFCVWAVSPNVDDHSWQPLECVPPTALVELMRRSAKAAMWLDRLVKEDNDLGFWIADPPRPEEDGISYTPFPGTPDYVQGNCPDRPETPTRAFTPKEQFVADNTIFRHQQYLEMAPNVRSPEHPHATVTQVSSRVHAAHDVCSCLCCPIFTMSTVEQFIEEGRAQVVADDKVIAEPTQSRVLNNSDVSGGKCTVFQFMDNSTYNPRFAPE